eukprot:TRINITY_DN1430_c0_g1_i2.p1 TRINITY_DN1430_c0_g1~~TRINITY_DN1430_c0_g1_i2.p1  ORF type:complete len:744 (-),score=64.64 TRINITY_DN1430_c0_g1_i2:167-2398(-)
MLRVNLNPIRHQFIYHRQSNRFFSSKIDVRKWSTTEVLEWMKKIPRVEESDLEIFKKQRLTGDSLFKLNEKRLTRFGIPFGPTMNILDAIAKLQPLQLAEEWKMQSEETRFDLIAPFGSKMPVVQRSEEIAMTWIALMRHYCGWKRKIMDRQEHPRCFAYGPPGSGKTKFGITLIPLLKSHGQQLVKENRATSEDKELLGQLENVTFIHITFANGNSLLPEERGNIQLALIVRGIRNLFNITTPLGIFYRQYQETIKSWDLNTLLLIAKNLSKSERTQMIYIHLDEFNHLFNENPEIFKDAVRLLSSPLCSPFPGVFYYVLFTGTAYYEMKKLGVSESYPLIEIPMKILDRQGIYQMVSIMRAEGNLPWCSSSWKKNIPFVLSLLNTGGLPRGLEYLLEALQMRLKAIHLSLDQITIHELQIVNNIAETALLTRYTAAFIKSFEVYGEALALAILGENITLDSPLLLDRSETYASLLSTGSILLKSVGSNLWRIQLPIMWFLKYVENLKLSFLPKRTCEYLTSIDQGSWNDWERVVSIILMLRINSIRILKRPSFQMRDILPGAEGPIDLLDRKFVTETDYYTSIDSPHQFLKNKKTTLKGNECYCFFETGKVWFNTVRGPAFETWTVFQTDTTPKRHTVLFVQCKFSCQGTPLYTQDIITAYDELKNMWNNLLKEGDEKIKTPTYLNNFDVAFVVISNRELRKNHKEDAQSIYSLSQCIIYEENSIDLFLGTFSSRFLKFED